jgi:two-component sensor histidine kinase
MKVDIVESVDGDGSPVSNDHQLVRELTHRVSNEFASVIGLVSLIAARSNNDDVKDSLSSVMDLLHNYAGAHRALQMPTYSTVVDASSYIRTLCQSIRRAKLDYRDIKLELVECPIEMRSDRCWKLGMIVSELITNSMRHAFDGGSGTIRVELSESGTLAKCCVMDNGASRGRHAPGEGLKIVEALAKELNGEIAHRFGPEGAQSIVIFPISAETRQIDSLSSVTCSKPR